MHFCLLEALGSPLNKEGQLRVYVHTNDGYVIAVNPEARLPRNYSRFIGLVEQLYELGKVPSECEALLKLEHKTLKQLLSEVKADYVLAFSRAGKPKTIHDAVCSVQEKKRLAVLVGGFPHGCFSEATLQLADEVVSVDSEMLEAWVVTSRVIYERERAFSVPKKRLKH